MDLQELLMLNVLRIVRILHLDRLMRLTTSTHAFSDYFKGLEKVETVRQIFGARTEEVLRDLKIGFTWVGGYMWVDGFDGHLMVNANYLNRGDKVDIYLDLVHELVHVRQFREGKELFDSNYDYVERPTEIEAYRYAVEEARRLGLSDKRIREYLKTEWMSQDDLKRLAKALNVNYTC
jgi:hypothetical protein